MTDVVSLARKMSEQGSAGEAARLLEQASDAGNGDAAAELGIWLLRGNAIPRDLPRARHYLGKAARLGSEEAILLEIALTANGTGGPVDWQAAKALLQEGARHFSYLRKELATVEELQLDADGFPTQLPQAKILDARVGMVHFPNFLSGPECQHIANVTLNMLRPSTVFDPGTGRQIAHPIRTSDGAVIGPTQEDLVLQAIYRRIAATTGTSVQQGESLSVLRYAPGQQYRPHFDALAKSPNNRIKTVLMYLNDSYTGGQTSFPDTGITFEPKAGDALVFDGLAADGSVNPLSRHAGLPVLHGTKWVATRWIRAHAFDPWLVAGEA